MAYAEASLHKEGVLPSLCNEASVKNLRAAAVRVPYYIIYACLLTK